MDPDTTKQQLNDSALDPAIDEIAEPVTDSLKDTVGRRAVKGAALLTGATYISILLGIAARKALALLLTGSPRRRAAAAP